MVGVFISLVRLIPKHSIHLFFEAISPEFGQELHVKPPCLPAHYLPCIHNVTVKSYAPARSHLNTPS